MAFEEAERSAIEPEGAGAVSLMGKTVAERVIVRRAPNCFEREPNPGESDEPTPHAGCQTDTGQALPIQNSVPLASDRHFAGSMEDYGDHSKFRLRDTQGSSSYHRNSRHFFADRQGFTGLPSRKVLPDPLIFLRTIAAAGYKQIILIRECPTGRISSELMIVRLVVRCSGFQKRTEWSWTNPKAIQRWRH